MLAGKKYTWSMYMNMKNMHEQKNYTWTWILCEFHASYVKIQIYHMVKCVIKTQTTIVIYGQNYISSN